MPTKQQMLEEIKNRNKKIDDLLEDVYAAHFGTKNRVELILRLEGLKDGKGEI